MTKSKSTAPQRVADLAAARKARGNEKQPNWLDRLWVVMKRRAKAEKK
jgi:hypothetical protein